MTELKSRNPLKDRLTRGLKTSSKDAASSSSKGEEEIKDGNDQSLNSISTTKNGIQTGLLSRWKSMSLSEQRECEERVFKSKAKIDKESQLTVIANDRDGYTSLSREEQKISFKDFQITKYNREHLSRLNRWDPSVHTEAAVLYGDVGTGKSSVCKALINKWASAQYRCFFIGAGVLIERIKKAIDDKEDSVDLQVNRFMTYDMLVIDDLGTEKATEWAYSQLFDIYDGRCRHGRHTFFTSNLKEEQMISRYGGRIFDRLVSSSRMFHMAGPSFRKALNNKDSW